MNSPSSALAVAARGSTEARLFTPPLRELTPDTSWGFECIDFIENVLGWELLPYQKWLYIHALEKSLDGKGFRFQTLVILISRQNGKTLWLKGLGLWRLYVDGAKQVLISAQNLEFAETTLSEAVDEVKNNRLLKAEFEKFSQTNGKYKLCLAGGREWRAAVSTRKGGRSLSVDLALLDELREHQNWLAWNAIVPTTTARPRSLVVAASNAGDATSVVLRSLRDGCINRIVTGATRETRTGLFEWSAPDEADPLDQKFWALANPAMGYLFEPETLSGRAEAMFDNMAGFKTEHLALDIATPILTPRGWTTMADIKVGDEVYHPDGHPIVVTGTTDVFSERPCYEVETTDGRRLIADEDHRWMVNDRRSNRGWETVTTGELVRRGTERNKTGGRFAYRLPRQQAIISKPVDLPIDPYVLGAWLGDGTAGKSEITCIDSESDELIRHLGVNITSSRRIGNARRIQFRITPGKSRDGFPARCRDLGIWTSKRIPDIYLIAGAEQRLALLQGLCDTDGSIDTNGRVRYCSTNKEMAEQVLYLARSLGWRATLREGESKYGGKVFGAAYYVSWTHDANEPSPFRLQRKRDRINTRPSRAGERTTVSIRSITPVTSRPTRCIMVDSPDSLWLAGRDLVPTANCQWVDALEAGIIPAEDWIATTDPGSKRAEGSTVWASVDINFGRTKGYIAIAAKRDDDKMHVEVVAAERGTEWIVPWFEERKDRFAGVVIQARGAPASVLIDPLREAGIEVLELGGSELTKCYGYSFDLITERKLFHRPSPVLDAAAESAKARIIGDSWVIDRKNSPIDASPLVACFQAVWGEQIHDQISVYASQDVLIV